MDRQDIDALLIGALYGELTPADEARLAAHLESHPTDRGALDDLKSARTAVRDSRIFELQLEPPQAVSALLLQEAHRRAPKRAASEARDEKESWFFRFTRVFLAHPAMAAAAMLVLVVGVFGVVQMRKGDHFADKAYAPSSQSEPAQDMAKNEATATGAAQGSGISKPGPGDLAMDVGAAEPADDDAGEAEKQQQGYAVQLDEAARGRRAGADPSLAREQQADQVARHDESPKKAKGMIVTTPDRQPKELAERKKPVAKSATVPKRDVAGGDPIDGFALEDSNTGAAGGSAPPRTRAPAVAPRGGLAGAPKTGAGDASGGAAPSTESVTAQRAPQNAPAPAQAAPSAPPPPPAVATAPTTTARPTPTKAAEKPADAKSEAAAPSKDNALIAWAKGEHSRTVALANKGDCIAAAKAAVAVQNRAPDYYTQFMATDRALKKCQAYIAQERDADAERSGKSRAQKRVNADAPAATSK